MALEYREAIRELSTPDKISYPLPVILLPFSLPTLDDVSKRCLRVACGFQRDFSFERIEDPPGVVYWLNSRTYGSLGGLRLSLLENQTAVMPIPVSPPTGQEMSSLQIPYHSQKTLFEAKKTASAQLFRMYLIFLRDDIIWETYPNIDKAEKAGLISLSGQFSPQTKDNQKKGLPQKAKTLKKWKDAYNIICKTRRRFKQSYDKGDTDNPNPEIKDFIEALKAKGIKYTDRQIREITKAGDQDLLT